MTGAGGAEHEGGDGVGDGGVAEPVELPQHEVGELAGLQRADVRGPAEDLGAAVRAQPQRPADVQRLLAAREPVDQQGVAQLGVEFAGLVGGGAVDAEADGDTRAEHGGDAGGAGAEPGVGGGAVGDARAGAGEGVDVGVVHVDAVGHPHVVAEPAGGLEVVGGAHPEPLLAEALLLHGLRAVCVQPYALAAGEHGGLAHQVGGDGEGRAGRDADAQHRVGGRVVVGVDGLFGGGEGGFGALHGEVGGQAAVGGAEVHRAAGGVEADAEFAGGADFGAQEVAGAAGEDVVVVHGGGDAAAHHHRERSAGGRVDHGLVDTGPDGVEGDEPVEEAVVLGEAAGEPLVEVVVGVDQAGRGQVAAAVDAADVPGRLCGGRARGRGIRFCCPR
ncbi:hypothetical protein GCM10020000_16730 [Streptomyces olivoverticillatus]